MIKAESPYTSMSLYISFQGGFEPGNASLILSSVVGDIKIELDGNWSMLVGGVD